ncbi:hypothetical protein I312_101583 [Cryptococcus bacillisporus CA1280]
MRSQTATMNPTTLSMTSRSAFRAPTIFVRASSSQPQPSYPPQKANGRTLPVSTLRELVSLHHTSAGFMHSTAELPIGFDNAFRLTPRPHFERYSDFRRAVEEVQSLHPPGGMENLVEKSTKRVGVSGSDKAVYGGVQRAFKKLPGRDGEPWVSQTTGVKKTDRDLTERQMRVREAIYGTWERGGMGMNKAEPGLDGIFELIEAKGKTVEEYGKEWAKREEEPVKGRSTEDGM